VEIINIIGFWSGVAMEFAAVTIFTRETLRFFKKKKPVANVRQLATLAATELEESKK